MVGSDKTSVLIVGAGEFGSSTALSLLETGKYTVTLIDRAQQLPALDAASTDLNKVVRWDYSDPDYAKLCLEAIKRWSRDFKGIYHQTGVVVTGLEQDGIDGDNARKTYDIVKSGEGVHMLESSEAIFAKLNPEGKIKTASFPPDAKAYWNPVGGWAAAAEAVEKLYERIRPYGAKIVPGAELSELIVEGGDVRGVKTVDGREFRADKTIICTGSWTSGHPALKELIPQDLITATGQCVGAVQLKGEEWEKYKKIPICFKYDGSGYYSFPPNKDGLLKFAIHGAGYTVESGIPRTALDPAAVQYTKDKQVGWIPSDALKQLKRELSLVYPELAKKPLAYTRMCWYSDVVDGNWVIDYVEKYPSLMIAAGGSGHAFKFLPVIGEVIRKRLENTLEPHLAHKWRLQRSSDYVDPQRVQMQRKALKLDQLVKAEEMAGAETANL